MNARRFDITAEEIGVVVARFYADIRHHPVLGPVFARHVTDWSEHESRIIAVGRVTRIGSKTKQKEDS